MQKPEVTDMARQLISQYPKRWKQACENPNLLGWFVSKAMRTSNGKASLGEVRAVFHSLSTDAQRAADLKP